MSWKKRIAIGLIVGSSLIGMFKDELPIDVYNKITSVIEVVSTINQAIPEE